MCISHPIARLRPASVPAVALLIVLTVDTAAMHRDGHVFRVSANGVWLTEAVPPRYLRFPAPH